MGNHTDMPNVLFCACFRLFPFTSMDGKFFVMKTIEMDYFEIQFIRMEFVGSNERMKNVI